MKTAWQIKDLIDLEYFLHADETAGDEPQEYEAAARRDRDIYLQHIGPLTGKDESLPRRSIIKEWLEKRRSAEKIAHGPDSILPGEAFFEVHRILVYALVISGFLIGSGLAFSLLTYKGTHPLNVSVYLGVLVLLQILLLLLLGAISLVRLVKRPFFHGSMVFSLISGLLVKLTLKLRGEAMRMLPGDRRMGLEAAVGLVRGRGRVYGSLFYWPVFILAQVFGAGFNLGALSGTLLRVMGSDIAFGWQSTVQFSPRAVYDLVKIVALPWSWFVPPEISHPSLAQIEGSRIVLKDGIYHLATQDLVSWWPFLCLAVLFYGLIPRMVLLIAGLTARGKVLGRLDFGQSACDRLIHRMKTPLVSTKGLPTGTKREEYAGVDDDRLPGTGAPGQGDGIEDMSLIALIPDDVFEECKDDELNAVVRKTLGYRVREKIRINEDYEGDRAVLDELAKRDWGDVRPDILLLVEAWQPPIQETLAFIQDLRRSLGEKSRILVGLVGRPEASTFFTTVNERNRSIWKMATDAMGDPYLGVERLVADEP